MSKVKLTKNSWVDLKEIDSEETLEKVKQKFVEAGVGKIDPRYARWGNLGCYVALRVIGGYICFRSPYFIDTKDNVSVKELLEEDEVPPFGKQLFGYKMRVTPEISELVQKAVFEAGGSWMSGNRKVYENIKYICIDSSGSMCHLNGSDSWFNDYNFPEIKLEVVKSLKIISKEDPVQVKQQKELQEVIDNLKEQLHTAQQQLDNIKGE